MTHGLNDIRSSQGFTLIELIGILAVMAILSAVLLPNAISRLFQQAQDTEYEHLHRIAQGVELYLHRNLAFPPSLAALSPEYAPYDVATLTKNERGFTRYLVIHPTMTGFSNATYLSLRTITASRNIHPTMTGFSNATGLNSVELADARFLLISRLDQDANPAITNAPAFETWWTTDDSTDPNLHIFRGNVGSLFHQLTVTAVGAGASYQIMGTSTNSGGGTLATHTKYHLRGTLVGFDEANAYATPEVQFALTTNTAYWFDPRCLLGKQWNSFPTNCGRLRILKKAKILAF